LFSIGAARAPATDVALISMLEPIMGPIWVWIFVDEYPGVPALIGGTIVFVALAAHTIYAASRSDTAERLHDEPLDAGMRYSSPAG
jgi:drug/metabolite transporter (DMT)-like permease